MAEKTTIATRAGAEPAARGALRESPTPTVVSMILGLQQANGNQAVGRLLGGSLLQARLRIGPPGDTYEREADRVADRILRDGSSAPIPISVAQVSSRVQRQCHCQDDDLLQRKGKCQEQEGEELIQPKRNGGSLGRGRGIDARVNAMKGTGRPLPDRVRGFFEPRFGHDFSTVRVHTGTAAGDAANAIGARAFTVGNDVVFGGGEWSPYTQGGRQLLAHELTHVVQQTPLVARRTPQLEPASGTATESASDAEGVTGPENAAPSPEAQAPEPSGVEAGEAVPAASVVVDDDASDVGAGQMKKTEFLGRLMPEVCGAAEAGLSGTEHTAQGCPFIAFVFGYYEDKSSAQLNSDLPKFIEGQPPTTAEEYITRIVERVRTSVEVWARTGTITGVPRAVLFAAMQVPEIEQLRAQAAEHGIQFKARAGGARSLRDPAAVRGELGKGRPLAGSLRSRMESALGHSFAHVQVHTDGRAAALSHRFNARAFTIGNHVAFGAGDYRPGTIVGDVLMAHELAHVAQQSGAAESTQPTAINDSSYGALERDADMAAVGAVASLWGMRIPSLRQPMRTTPRLSSGLRLQRCGDCNGQKAPSTGLSSGSITGGITGLTMNVTVTYSDCSACKDGLEAIQVFWGTRRTDGVQVGTHQATFPPSKTTYDSFVDGGANSPGGAVYTGNHPYYVGRPDLPKSYGYVGGQGSAGKISGCVANPQDTPGAAALHQEAFFETAIACLNYQDNGSDKLMDAFKWGFTSLGTTFKPSPTSSGGSMETAGSPSAKFEETLKADYPGYTHV